MESRVLIASEYNAKDKAHFAQSFEFCSVVASCDTADVVAPSLDHAIERRFKAILPPHDGDNVQRDFNRLANGLRKGLGLKNAPSIESVVIDRDYELFFFVAWSPQSLVELTRMKGWRRRCKIAVAYLFELWSSTLEEDRAYLKLLDQFDHVFLLHGQCIPHLAAYTKAPCSVLPVGVDCLMATPYPSPPKRVIDVYSFGNRSAAVHRTLLEMTRQDDIFYVYDTLTGANSPVRDWAEHRALLTGMIKRSRYFIGFSPASLAGAKAGKVAGEQVVPARLFEGAAGGAIILGSAPRCPEFDACFDWPDAVIEVSPDGSDIESIIRELDANPDWTERIRRTNVAGCLRKHDWAHRWEHILSAVGMQPLPQLADRKATLNAIAAMATGKVSAGAVQAIP
ncbi:MAG TPA: glycosyltransferase [Rhodopila sp.]|nr:glycosyltransferase [Rhodopila sp.]